MTHKQKKLGHETIALPRGFTAAGIVAGLKKSGAPDMAMFYSETPAVVAGVFTTNQVKAAPVRLDMDHLKGRTARAIVMNSGNANACNGAAGMRAARRMAALTADLLDVPVRHVFVSSTGTIGMPLPMPVIENGIRLLVPALTPDGGVAASEAMMTTDLKPKRWTVDLKIDGRPVRLAAVCKGSGMIEPRMATMLCYILTDAAVAPAALQRGLREAVDQSFNRVTVDGDRSTNDTVLMLANGQAGNRPLKPGHRDWTKFIAAVKEATLELALMMARDGEGATKMVTVRVRGARNDREADIAARSVANSNLIKTSWAGERCNWGRVMDALGYSDAKVVEEKVDIRYNGLVAVRRGMHGPVPRERLSEIIRLPEFTIDIDLHLGRGMAVVYTCNFTEDYVKINV